MATKSTVDKPCDKKSSMDVKFILGDEGFWGTWISKLLFTIISVKVWGLFACTIVSSVLLGKKLISGTEWLTFNTTIWALIFGMKEVFRISEGKDRREAALIQQRTEADEQLMITQQMIKPGTTPQVNPDGTVTVGEDPDELQ